MARPYWSRQVQILGRVVHVACRIFWASSECDFSPEAVCGEVGAQCEIARAPKLFWGIKDKFQPATGDLALRNCAELVARNGN